MLKQYENVSYRRLVEWLATATAVTDAMGITRLPHYTTLQKAADRIDVSAVHGMITGFVEIGGKIGIDIAAIDASGFQPNRPDSYYTEVQPAARVHQDVHA